MVFFRSKVNKMKLECSSNPKVSELWGVIWKLVIPNAGKNFMRRACHNLLPTKRNLLYRKVVQESMCPICGMEETVEPLVGEIMAACVAVQLCSEMEGQTIIFEGDALQVVNAVNSEEQNLSRNGHLIRDMKLLL
jgi:hypothetical protein